MSSNSEAKRPQTKEWWRTRGGEIRCIVADVSGVADTLYPILAIHNEGGISTYTLDGKYYVDGYDNHSDLVEHLPYCDSFKWVPEMYPQYWTTIHGFSQAAFMKRLSKDDCHAVLPSGINGPILFWESCFPEKRTQITEAEAMALLDKPEPVESPDDWVTQDRCEARPGVDEAWWSYGGEAQKPDTLVAWWQVRMTGSAYGKKNGHQIDGGMLNLRCRRKYLPPIVDAVSESPWQTIEIGGKRYEIRELRS